MTDVRPKSRSHGVSSRIRRRSLKYDESFETMDESVLVHTPEEEVDRVAYRWEFILYITLQAHHIIMYWQG